MQLRKRKHIKWLAILFLTIFLALGTAGVSWLLHRRLPDEQAQAYYQHAIALIEQHDYAKAKIELRNALNQKHNLLQAWRSLAKIDEVTQDWSGSAASLRAIVQLDPGDVPSRAKLAKLLSLSGNIYQALEVTKQNDGADVRNPTILGVRAAILYRLNDTLGAVQSAKDALSIDPGNADALVVLATDQMAKGDKNAALQILESDAAVRTRDLGIQLLKLEILVQLGDMQKVESLLRELMVQHPQQIGFRRQLIRFYHDQNRDGDAEKVARSAVNANPTDSEAELDLVQFLNVSKGIAAAKDELTARIEAGGDVFPFQIALADLDLAQGDFIDAEKELRELANRAHSAAQARLAQTKLAEAYLKLRKIDAAEALAAEILSKDGRDRGALRIRASVRIIRGQFDSAIADLQQAINDQPRSPDLMLLLALAHERSGAFALAEKEYADAVNISNFNPLVGLEYASFLLRGGNLERAQQFLAELNRRAPKNLVILSALANVELVRQDWVSAQTTAESIREVKGADGVAEQIRGAALFGQHKFDESIEVYQSAFESSPSAVQPMVSLVRALLGAKKVDSAKSLLAEVLKANPDNAEAHMLLGSIQLSDGAKDKALENFKLAIEKQPKNIAGYQGLADLYASDKKFDQALETIRSGLRLQPNDLHFQQAAASMLERAGQFEAAIAEYERMIIEQPDSITTANNLASLLADYRDDKASLEKAQALAASLRDSPIPQFKDTLGWIRYRNGDYVGAIQYLEAAAAQLPKMPLVHYHLGMSYMAVGRTTSASEQLKVALLSDLDGALETRIRAALAKLKP